jgi:hypothetical protein
MATSSVWKKIFRQMELPVRGKKCKGMEGLLEEGKTVIEEDAEPHVKDAALIAAAQKEADSSPPSEGDIARVAKPETQERDRA